MHQTAVGWEENIAMSVSVGLYVCMHVHTYISGTTGPNVTIFTSQRYARFMSWPCVHLCLGTSIRSTAIIQVNLRYLAPPVKNLEISLVQSFTACMP